MLSMYFLLLSLPNRVETCSLALQDNQKWCKSSFFELWEWVHIFWFSKKNCANASTTISTLAESTSPFTLPSKSGRGVADMWKAHFPHCLASTSVKCPGNSTFECILVFLVLSAEAASQSTSNASWVCYIFDSFCLSPQTKVIVHLFVSILLCQACNKPCHSNGVKIPPSVFTCKKLLP